MKTSADYTLLDANGIKVQSGRFSTGSNTLKIENLAAGTYWITVDGVSKKIVVLGN